MLAGLTLIIISILAAPSFILSKAPKFKQYLDKVTPYQGWIGVIACIWGVYGVLADCLFGIGLVGSAPLYWATLLVVNLLLVALGFMLGYTLIYQYVLSKNEAAKAKGEKVLAKLTPMQNTLGIVGLFIGLWSLIAAAIY